MKIRNLILLLLLGIFFNAQSTCRIVESLNPYPLDVPAEVVAYAKEVGLKNSIQFITECFELNPSNNDFGMEYKDLELLKKAKIGKPIPVFTLNEEKYLNKSSNSVLEFVDNDREWCFPIEYNGVGFVALFIKTSPTGDKYYETRGNGDFLESWQLLKQAWNSDPTLSTIIIDHDEYYFHVNGMDESNFSMLWEYKNKNRNLHFYEQSYKKLESIQDYDVLLTKTITNRKMRLLNLREKHPELFENNLQNQPSRYVEVDLNIPTFVQTKSNTCWVAVASAILYHHKNYQSQSTILNWLFPGASENQKNQKGYLDNGKNSIKSIVTHYLPRSTCARVYNWMPDFHTELKANAPIACFVDYNHFVVCDGIKGDLNNNKKLYLSINNPANKRTKLRGWVNADDYIASTLVGGMSVRN